MPIKKIHVGFDIDMEVFMKMLQHGNSSMNINVYGDDPSPSKQNKSSQKLLAPPKRMGARKLILNYLVKHSDQAFASTELKNLVVERGYATGTSSSQLHGLLVLGMIKRTKYGKYQATAKAIANGEE
jgi:hypothetical protein